MKNFRNRYLFARLRKLPLILVMTLLLLHPDLAQTMPPGDTARGSPASAKTYAGLEMLTADEGVDFSHYLQALYLRLKREWFARMPPSALLGERGIVQVQFHVLKDGSVPSDFVKLTKSSGKKDLDGVCLNAVHNAAPYGNLPGNFSQPFIDLRMAFYFNTDPKNR